MLLTEEYVFKARTLVLQHSEEIGPSFLVDRGLLGDRSLFESGLVRGFFVLAKPNY